MANEPASPALDTKSVSDSASANDATPAPGSVALLGAGPGDPELITARALRRLSEADVVLYDALVHPDLLAHAKPSAELVFVGKRAGRVSERQTNINQQLLDAAKAGKKVARLKGGDPYLFGRGSEEAEELAAHGIPFEVVPGVASPMAASAYTGISLTHRNLASSVAYVTATESVEKDESAHDWDKLATATQTLVFFMGLRKLDSLMQRLVAHGRAESTPAAVVSHASLPSQRTVVGTVGTIAERAKEAGVEMPALTIVGSVVSLHEHLRWFEKLPLFGKRVLVTRPEGQGDEMARLLRDAGAEPIELPAVQIVPAEDTAPLEAAVQNLASYDWVIFTSVNGVRFFFAALFAQNLDTRALGRAKIAAVGPATRDALRAYGIRADVMPEEHRGEGLADALLSHGSLAGARVLLPRALVAREVLPQKLREHGAEVQVVTAYRTLPTPSERFQSLREELSQGRVHVVTFTSSSTVDKLVEGLGQDARALLSRTCVAAISPITAASAQKHGLEVQVVAREYTAEGLVKALVAQSCELHDRR
jgi:uroporphyrinogen III methyltransferase/synthase